MVSDEKTAAANPAQAGAAALSSEDVSRVIANITHELKTPLHSILAVASVLQSEVDGPLNQEQQRQVGMIIRNGEHLLERITELLQFSSLRSESRTLRLTKLSIRTMFERLLEGLAPVAAKSNVKLDVELSRLAETFVSDEAVLGRIFGNLLSNAVKFSPNGGVVTLFAETRTDGGLRVEVADQGIGIPYELQRAVFNEFFQVDAGDSRRFGGVGLGLTLVKSSVSLLGGELELKSEPDQGTLFTVLLPSKAEELQPEKILVVATDEVLCLTLRECFSHEGYQVHFLSEVDTLPRQLAEFQPAVVLIDLEGVHEPFLGMLKEVRTTAWGKDVPVIVMSSIDAPHERGQAFAHGATDFLAKPFDATELRARVRAQLER